MCDGVGMVYKEYDRIELYSVKVCLGYHVCFEDDMQLCRLFRNDFVCCRGFDIDQHSGYTKIKIVLSFFPVKICLGYHSWVLKK